MQKAHKKKMVHTIKRWLKDERSLSIFSENALYIFLGVVVAIGLAFVLLKYVIPGASSLFANFGDISDKGLDPNNPPSFVDPWE